MFSNSANETVDRCENTFPLEVPQGKALTSFLLENRQKLLIRCFYAWAVMRISR